VKYLVIDIFRFSHTVFHSTENRYIAFPTWVRYKKKELTADKRTLDADKSVPHPDENRYIPNKYPSDDWIFLPNNLEDI
jgi:hypothetical protein